VVHAFYPCDWLAVAENPNTPNQKIGPLFAYTFAKSWGGLQRPTVILVLNWWLQNRYRTGQRVTQALPYGIVAFTFSGELWRQK
ncbi:MAG: hypothetical protein KAI47_23910, partial [Deltaproteobacteria bacterium]|nr:hypothetical protein [Deltaproteobacteria bacterium]